MDNPIIMLELGPRLSDYLDELLAVGVHGETREEVVLTLVQRGIEDAMASGLIQSPALIRLEED